MLYFQSTKTQPAQSPSSNDTSVTNEAGAEVSKIDKVRNFLLSRIQDGESPVSNLVAKKCESTVMTRSKSSKKTTELCGSEVVKQNTVQARAHKGSPPSPPPLMEVIAGGSSPKMPKIWSPIDAEWSPGRGHSSHDSHSPQPHTNQGREVKVEDTQSVEVAEVLKNRKPLVNGFQPYSLPPGHHVQTVNLRRSLQGHGGVAESATPVLLLRQNTTSSKDAERLLTAPMALVSRASSSTPSVHPCSTFCLVGLTPHSPVSPTLSVISTSPAKLTSFSSNNNSPSVSINPANTRHLPNAVSMLGQRRRRLTNIKTALGECLVLAGNTDM